MQKVSVFTKDFSHLSVNRDMTYLSTKWAMWEGTFLASYPNASLYNLLTCLKESPKVSNKCLWVTLGDETDDLELLET